MTAPFSDQIVSDPRHIASSVDALHQPALFQLIDAFRQLSELPPPRPRSAQKGAYLLVSPQHGFGKSHLIGRLFQVLDNEAICVYLTPFLDPARCWQSVLLKTVQELELKRAVPQLEHISSCVFLFLTRHVLESQQRAELYESYANAEAELEQGRPEIWFQWIETHVLSLLPAALRDFQIDLEPSNHAWLQILFRYASAPRTSPLRHDCLNWLKARPLDDEQADAIGLRAFERIPSNIPFSSLDALCRSRLSALCQLCAFGFPLLFCFDQTESFGHDPALARRFGYLVSELVSSSGPHGLTFPNHMTLVTTNQLDWQNSLLPHMVHAEAQRFCPSDPILLEPLNLEQGRALIAIRLAHAGVPDAQIHAFAHDPWIATYFAEHRGELGIRQFLIECQRQWTCWTTSELDDAIDVEFGEEESLADQFERVRNAISKDAKLQRYDEDAILGFIRWIAGSDPQLTLSNIEDSRYHPLALKAKAATCLFVFEAGNNHKRWGAIRRESQKLCRAGSRSGHTVKSVVFRTPELDTLPGNWKDAKLFRAATQSHLDLITLEPADIAALYAAHRLSHESSALPDDRNAIFAQHLKTLRARVLEPMPAPLGRGTKKKSKTSALLATSKKRLAIPRSTSDRTWSIAVGDLSALCLRAQPQRRHFEALARPRPMMPLRSGERFHRLIEAFVRHLHNATEPGLLPGAPPSVLWKAFDAHILPDALPESGPVVLEDALMRCCAHISALGAQRAAGSTWKKLFVAAEQPVSRILKHGNTRLRVRGRIDALRLTEEGDALEVVDYKLSKESEPSDRDRVQLAIYAHVFQSAFSKPISSGVLERYTPALKLHIYTLEQLSELYQRVVAPVLDALFGSQSRDPTAAAQSRVVEDPLLEMGQRIVKVLGQYGVEVDVLEPIEAPQLVRYRVQPKGTTTVRQIANRARELRVKLALDHVPMIRHAAGHVHIDIPKTQPDVVPWEPFPRHTEQSPLSFPLGIGTDGEPLWADFADSAECHMLVAGMSGSGKSEFLKSMLASLALHNSTERLQLTLIDPKRVTFGLLKDSPFLEFPVLSAHNETLDALTHLVNTMEETYAWLEARKLEHIGQARDAPPYHVIVIDEYADIMLTLQGAERSRFDTCVTRLAQKGRAAGFHLVLATQNPLKRVVTSLIKSNLPLKVCFQVANTRTSMNVLDQTGAELMLGHGDFLCMLRGVLERGQAPFITQRQLVRMLCPPEA